MMRLILESTPDLGTIEIDGTEVPARVWLGETGEGTKVLAFITRIAPLAGEDGTDLERELVDVSDTTSFTATERKE